MQHLERESKRVKTECQESWWYNLSSHFTAQCVPVAWLAVLDGVLRDDDSAGSFLDTIQSEFSTEPADGPGTGTKRHYRCHHFTAKKEEHPLGSGWQSPSLPVMYCLTLAGHKI